MSKLTDRASYLKGLADGMDLNMEKGSNKLLVEALSVMQEMAEELEKLSNAHDELNEYVESIDDDLADLEDVLFGDEEDEEDDCDDDECGCGCGHHHDDDEKEDDEDEEEEDEEELISYECPHCGHEIVFKASDVDFDEDYLCPACGKPVFPELDEEDEEDEDKE